MGTTYENQYVSYNIHEGILRIECKANIRVTLEAAQQIIADRLMFQADKDYPVLCLFSGIIKPHYFALEYFAREGSLMIKAVAFVIKKRHYVEYLVSLYLKIGEPLVPTKIFEDQNTALCFLKKHL